MELKSMCVCLFLFLKNNDISVCATYLKILKGSTLLDERTVDKEKE